MDTKPSDNRVVNEPVLILCIDVDRYEGAPLYTVQVVDIANPVNFHSYDCLQFEQGRDLEETINCVREEYRDKIIFPKGLW